MKSASLDIITEVEKSITWARELQRTIDILEINEVVDPISARIPRKLNSFHWLPASIQCLSTCRFKELKYIKLESLFSREPVSIYQPKTKTWRTVADLMLPGDANETGLDRNAKILHTSYDSYAQDLMRNIPENVKKVLDENNSISHVFRHLRASWMFKKGQSIDEIKEYFGHISPETTAKYIHKEMCFG